MLSTIRKGAMTVAALGALGLGGAAIAGAADTATPTATPTPAGSGSSSQTRPAPPPELSGDVAAKVKAAALAKVPGATVVRTQSGGPYGTPYHAHVKTSDGTLKVVLVNDKFEATAVQADQSGGRGGPGGKGGPGGPHGGPGGPGGGETPLTGDKKTKVEAAVLAKYAGATILRTETNKDATAPYESHVKTSDGKELEVLVSSDFKVVEAREHPPRP